MISFRILTGERDIIDGVVAAVPEAEREEIEEILSSFSDADDVEVAVSAADGCLLLRIFDLEYLFVYPIALTDRADEAAALNEIRLYAVKEEIPLTFIDVPAESLEELRSAFRNALAEDYDEERGSYAVRVLSEAALLDEIPIESDGDVSLSALSDSDKEAYTRLAEDEETNKYWGYDYRADAPLADGNYFLNTAREEFERGTALPLAVRQGGEFVGEAVIYAFDLRGGAECAVRLLPEHQGRKIGTRVLSMLISLGREIGLSRIYSTVHNENEASLRLFGRKMRICERNAGKTRFHIDL